MTGATPRKTPCSSCPFRESAPSGLWHPDEYRKLPAYDADMAAQPVATFGCHHADGQVCAGWLGFRDPADLLAVRVGIIDGRLDPSCAKYTTTVPLHPTATAACEHGLRDVERMSPAAIAAAAKLTRVRSDLTT